MPENETINQNGEKTNCKRLQAFIGAVLNKDDAIGYSHQNGTHDDVFWSIALAVYATVEMSPEPFLAVISR